MRFLTPILAAALLVACSESEAPRSAAPETRPPSFEALRVATFNVSLYRDSEGALLDELQGQPTDQLIALRSIINMVNPDILVLNEFDYDASGRSLDAFAAFLDAGYRYRLPIASNTGVASGFDLDQDGTADHPVGERLYGNDAFGYGVFPGQYAFAVLSRHPIDEEGLRTFQEFLWKDLPDNLLPQDYYSQDVQQVFRLSSKNHADVPVTVDGKTLHLLLAHPTPPGFDGEEDRNGRRNNDEVAFLWHYIAGVGKDWIVDDQGRPFGLPSTASFVILGDLNADPVDGDVPAGLSRHAISDLLQHPRVVDPLPKSFGGADAARRQEGGNRRQTGDPRLDTGDFSDNRIGNLRVDYVLPSSDLQVLDSGVFWPASDEPGFHLVGPGYPPVSSDHRLAWVDLQISSTD